MTSIRILVPVFNEEESIGEILGKIDKLVVSMGRLGIDKVTIIIKEGNSSDRSLEIIRKITENKPYYKVISGPDNGKWSALRIAMKSAGPGIYVVQDGDLEYETSEILDVIMPIVNNESDVCFGSRFLERGYAKPQKFINYLGNRLMSLIISILTRRWITDVHTCFKAWRSDLTPIITSDRFGGDMELAANLLKNSSVRYSEVPISYTARVEGKKLKAFDGFKLLFVLLKSLLFV
ncbi:MAG: glycosyltransferase family 2 protein [Candidatus Thorarchaeota archaeon]